MCVITDLAYITSVLTIFMPVTGYLKWELSYASLKKYPLLPEDNYL